MITPALRRFAPLLLGAIGLLGVGGCKGAGAGASVQPVAAAPSDDSLERELARAAAGVQDPALALLLREHWAVHLERSPVFATSIGVHAFDDRWPSLGPEARARAHQDRVAFLTRARALDKLDKLDQDDRLTVELFIAELESSEARSVCQLWAWSVSTRDNALSELAGVAELVQLRTQADATALLARYRSFPALVDAQIADLRDGLRRGLVADAETLGRTVDMLERQLAAPIDEWSAMTPVADAKTPDELAIRDQLSEVVTAQIAPALQRYVAVLRDELLPAARDGANVGVGALPDGAACYTALIQHHTSEQPSADQLHELGLAEIARIDAEFARLGERVFGTGELEQVLTRLRTDPALYFDSAEEVETFARESLAAASAAAPRWFARLPKTACEVRRIPDYEAPYTTIAYYRQPSEVEPGVYFINTHAPTTRPRYEARVLAIHEAVPGHHTQIAIAQELPDAPAFRRHGGTTVFVEGWALYTERLADEMGLYETDLDRLGVASFDAWRAARLVVDTGIHAKGWTREQAIAFMLAHTALAENNIINEVDRYVGWPGQALAYKYGQLELLRLRAEAEAALAGSFDIAGFHDVVLGAGPVTLPILRRRVRAWIAQQRGAN
ncbi:hypothetical protein DB30_01961 [Enhygromyxa salina]|uniref:DUF885 domain-containing protein n=1 Tax=Enhygromyxa salina TaxID=215803 RepID=A0A0C1ZKN6_9BACT|nr:DUF885 domain-containing protein [Enhygromyxa salina]KIG18074.1 hypothetical protein DB30_01961 [Enhygromyxa salina]